MYRSRSPGGSVYDNDYYESGDRYYSRYNRYKEEAPDRGNYTQLYSTGSLGEYPDYMDFRGGQYVGNRLSYQERTFVGRGDSRDPERGAFDHSRGFDQSFDRPVRLSDSRYGGRSFDDYLGGRARDRGFLEMRGRGARSDPDAEWETFGGGSATVHRDDYRSSASSRHGRRTPSPYTRPGSSRYGDEDRYSTRSPRSPNRASSYADSGYGGRSASSSRYGGSDRFSTRITGYGRERDFTSGPGYGSDRATYGGSVASGRGPSGRYYGWPAPYPSSNSSDLVD